MPAGPNERQLSSDATVGFQTGIAIAVAIFAVGIGTLAWFPNLAERILGNAPPPVLKWFPLFGIGTLGLFLAIESRLCTVYLGPNGLRIVRGRTEALVPFTEVSGVSQVRDTRGNRMAQIRIEFRGRTPFGTAITFATPMRVGFGEHPLVDELRRRAGRLTPGNH